MTGFTANILVSPIEPETCHGVMIEPPFAPADRVVTGPAIALEAASVSIILAVAGDAILWCIREYVRLMASFTFCFCVPAEQRKPRQAVVKKHVVLPGCLIVAVIAVATLRAFMSIVLFMACRAVTDQPHVEYRLNVTCVTADFFMGSEQGVAGAREMIELNVRPCPAGVTRAAVVAKVTVVVVVLAVTRDAAGLHLVAERFVAVTVRAFELRVASGKAEVRVS